MCKIFWCPMPKGWSWQSHTHIRLCCCFSYFKTGHCPPFFACYLVALQHPTRLPISAELVHVEIFLIVRSQSSFVSYRVRCDRPFFSFVCVCFVTRGYFIFTQREKKKTHTTGKQKQKCKKENQKKKKTVFFCVDLELSANGSQKL